MGAYHPGGLIEVIDDSPRHIPSENDLTGASVKAELAELFRSARGYSDGFVWVGLLDPTKPELLAVQEVFNLEHLQVEDAANARQRAKVDVSDDGSVFAVLKTLGYDEVSLVIDTGQVAVFTGPGFAITVRHGKHGDLTSIRERLKASAALREHGSLAVLYAIMDMTVDGYLAVVDAVAEDVSEVETDVFAMNPTNDVTKRIYELKRENMQARHAVQPLNRVAHEFADEIFEPMPAALKPFFRDIGEHILRAHEAIENIDSLLMTMLMASTAMQDLRQNADTRKISAWVAIAAVPTVAGGIYGMNFSNMPELDWAWGYPVVIGVIAVICLLLYRGFKRNGWL